VVGSIWRNHDFFIIPGQYELLLLLLLLLLLIMMMTTTTMMMPMIILITCNHFCSAEKFYCSMMMDDAETRMRSDRDQTAMTSAAAAAGATRATECAPGM